MSHPHLDDPEIRKWARIELVSRRALVGNVVGMVIAVQFERIPRWVKFAIIAPAVPVFAFHTYATDHLEKLIRRFYKCDD